MNFISANDLKNCAALSYKKVSAYFSSIFKFTLTHYDNAVGAFLKTPTTTQMLRQNINHVDELKKSKKLDFHVRKLK